MNAVSILPVLLRPRSRGEVRLQSTSPWDPPLLDPKYLTEDGDLDLLVEAVEVAFQLVNNSKRLQEHKFQVVKKQPHRIILGILLLLAQPYVRYV
jgi:choline dehydrogenase-like flavoprotein